MSTTSQDSAARDLATAFARFGPAFRKWVMAGVTATTYPRLRLLHQLVDGPRQMSRLSADLDVTPRNVTELVDGLEKEGLARRRPHPDDRRCVLVELTARGRRVVEEGFEAHLQRVSALFDRLSQSEQRTLLRLITKLSDELEALGAQDCADRRAGN